MKSDQNEKLLGQQWANHLCLQKKQPKMTLFRSRKPIKTDIGKKNYCDFSIKVYTNFSSFEIKQTILENYVAHIFLGEIFIFRGSFLIKTNVFY